METLEQFAAGLAERVGRPTDERPFVCEGSPLACRAVLVGSHPATMRDGDFWAYWEPGYGFRKHAWLADYAAQRVAAGGSPESPTRRVLERIVAAAAPVPCLETNVYPPTSAGNDVDPLRFLLDTVRPALIVAHGREAAATLAALLGAELPCDRFAALAAGWGTVLVRAVPHFARGWSFERADALGRAIRGTGRSGRGIGALP